MRIPPAFIGLFYCAVLAMLSLSCAHKAAPVAQQTYINESKIVAETSRYAQEQFALGRYKKALDIYSTAYDKYHFAGLRRGFVRLGEQIRNVSDTAYQRGDFAGAGIMYNDIYESGITTRDFARSLSFDDDYLSGQIETCSKALMETGLIKYREEKLDEAILIWKKILVFDVDNTEIKRAIERASIQLQQINNIK